MAVPSGDSVTCAYTNTAPTWSDSKQGWYGTGATVNNRYLEFIIYKSGVIFSNKVHYLRGREEDYKYKIIYKQSLLGTPITITANAITDIKFDTKIKDDWNDYNTSTGILKIKKSGLYLFNVYISLSTPATLGIRSILSTFRVYKNGTLESAVRGTLYRPNMANDFHRDIIISGQAECLANVDDVIDFKIRYLIVDENRVDKAENAVFGGVTLESKALLECTYISSN